MSQQQSLGAKALRKVIFFQVEGVITSQSRPKSQGSSWLDEKSVRILTTLCGLSGCRLIPFGNGSADPTLYAELQKLDSNFWPGWLVTSLTSLKDIKFWLNGPAGQQVERYLILTHHDRLSELDADQRKHTLSVNPKNGLEWYQLRAASSRLALRRGLSRSYDYADGPTTGIDATLLLKQLQAETSGNNRTQQ
jgi:hypothetical protein